MEMITYRRRREGKTTRNSPTAGPNDVVDAAFPVLKSNEFKKVYQRQRKRKMAVTSAVNDVVSGSIEVKVYHRRQKKTTVTRSLNDAVPGPLNVPFSAFSSENMVNPDDKADYKIRGFADCSNENQETETMKAPGDDDDDGGGGGGGGGARGISDSLEKSKAEMADPVEHDDTESHQQAGPTAHKKKSRSIHKIYAETEPICQYIQPGQMSESRAGPKETTDTEDSDYEEGMISKRPRKDQINSRQHSTRYREVKVGMNNSDFTTPLQFCGQLQRPVESGNSIDEEEIIVIGESSSEDCFNAYHLQSRRRGGRRTIGRTGSEVTVSRNRGRRQLRRRTSLRTSIMPEGYLNSMQFYHYMEHIWSEAPIEKKNSIAYMDSLWFNTYAEGNWKERVLKWVERRNIFTKKYVLVPIVIWSHWYLVIFCHFDESSTPCMLLLDSLHMAEPKRIEPLVRRFVMDIYTHEKRPKTKEWFRKIPFLVPSVPQQMDDKKCGYFVLYFIQLFMKNAPESFSIKEGYPYFMTEDWFTMEELESFCGTLDSVRVGSPS